MSEFGHLMEEQREQREQSWSRYHRDPEYHAGIYRLAQACVLAVEEAGDAQTDRLKNVIAALVEEVPRTPGLLR